MKTIKQFDFSGKKALVRVDFNVPQDENLKVTDNTRIAAVKPTIEKILSDGGSVYPNDAFRTTKRREKR